MKKIIVTVAFIFSTLIINAQITDYEFPSLNPPSPEAYELTKYGGMDINESSGRAQVNIPIYEYKSGQLTVPISINYMGNGVYLNDSNTWTGVNWTLQAGGLISRTVYDNPDEEVNNRLTQSYLDNLNLVNPHDNAQPLISTFEQPSWDTQPDIFNFSFLGYSGSFYLDDQFVPVLINSDWQLKIEIEGPTSNTNKYNLLYTKKFKITTPDGVIYYFGGTEIEESLMEYGAHTNVMPLATTAYYLTKIQHPINGIVFFEYETKSNFKIAVDIMHKVQIYNTPFPSNFTETKNGTGPLPDGAPTKTFKVVHQGKFLSRMYASPTHTNISVLFNSPPPTVNTGYNFKEILDNIEILSNTQLISKIRFTYIFNIENNVAEHFFLEKIEFDKDFDINGGNNSVHRKHHVYKFEYTNPTGLPKRFSYAQDHLGYYNGANGNTGFFPQVEHPHLSSYGNSGTNRIPNFEKSLYGTLKKVIYPTSGSTEFEYEMIPQKKHTNKLQFVDVSRNNYPLPGGGYYIDHLSNQAFINGNFINPDGSPDYTNDLAFDQSIPLNIKLFSMGAVPSHEKTYLKITNINNPNSPIVLLNQPIVIPYPDPNAPLPHLNETIVDYFFYKNIDYKIELILPSNSSGASMLGELSFSSINKEELVNAAGLRVKRVFDFANSVDSANVKRYYYTSKENVLKPTLDYVDPYIEPKYITNLTLLIQTSDSFTCLIEGHSGSVLNIYPENYKNFFENSAYETVTISYGGDNFENGGIEKKFDIESGGIVNVVHAPLIYSSEYQSAINSHFNASWAFLKKGKLLEEHILTRKNDFIYKLKKTSFGYTNKTLKTQFGFVGSSIPICGTYYRYENVGLARYDIRSKEVLLDSIIEINYVDPIPIAPGVDESNYKKITVTKSYIYDSYSGQPTKILTSSSESEKIYETKNYYLDEVSNLSGLTTQQITNYNNLIAQHRIGSPIQTKEFINENGSLTLLSTKRKIYNTFGNGKTQPSLIKISKGNSDLEERFIFQDYDSKGNLSELKQANGPTTRYLYNGYNQVIVEIKNFDGVIDHNANINSPCYNQEKYPGGLVTTYTYDSVKHFLIKITDPNCQVLNYEYDSFNRLVKVTDKEENIISENDYNFKVINN